MKLTCHKIHVGDDKRRQLHCSLCRARCDFVVSVVCILPPAKRGAAGGRKELRFCTRCLHFIDCRGDV